MKTFQVGQGAARPVTIGGEGLFVIAGPCVIESEAHAVELAGRISEIAARAGMPCVFKASFDKANRTSGRSPRGPGMKEGLRILARVRREIGAPILTDIHEPAQAAPVGEVVDILQIPAFLCRQTDLLRAAARTGRVVNIKKGQFLAPWDMKHAVEKVTEAGGERIILTERGASFGYNRLVADMTSLVEMAKLQWPVVFDATHSVQTPGGAGASSGGAPEHIAPLARAAVAVGVQGVFMEVHDDPPNALSDGANALHLDRLAETLESLMRIDAARRAGAG
jgi:2-dehydro-3-deoxyphosphooctonate aldolase (KDO 8-P synthase)